MKKVVDYVRENPKHKLNTIRKKCWSGVKDWKQISRMKECVNKDGNREQHMNNINRYVTEKFREGRNSFLPIHTIGDYWQNQPGIN